jgi:type IV pilus assembly protein PilA
MKKFTKLFKNQKGLTLIELLAVIVILAIVAAIAVPSIGNIINNTRDKAILSEATTIISGAKLAYTSGECKGTAGVVDSPAVPANDDICDATELTSYVEGVELNGASVSKTNWTLTWTGLADTNFKTTKYKVASPATETQILTALEK